MCTDEDKKPARKTCMKCEISMCVQHLQAHLTTPVLLQTHPLTEPMAVCGTTKCPQHGKLVEYYCLDDLTCVCVSCAIEDQHRLHNMKTFSTAHKELMEKLSVEDQALLVKTDDDNVSLEKWEKSEREKLARSSVRLIEAVSHLRNLALTSVQSSVSARMVSIKTSKSSLQAAQAEKDTFRFLQMYSQVQEDLEKAKAVDLRKGLEPGSDRDKLVQEIRQNGEQMMKQANHFWGSLLTLVDPENHQDLVLTSPDVFFDTQGLDQRISLSKDKRTAFYNSWLGQCSATLLLRSTHSEPNFQRWMVSLSQNFDWTVGLVDCQSTPFGGNKLYAIYGLSCEGNQLSTYTEEAHTVVCSPLDIFQGKKGGDNDALKPEMVEVFWNPAAYTVAFFNRTKPHQRDEIITLPMTHSNRTLVPCVRLTDINVQNMPLRPTRCNRKETKYHTKWPNNEYTTEVVCELR